MYYVQLSNKNGSFNSVLLVNGKTEWRTKSTAIKHCASWNNNRTARRGEHYYLIASVKDDNCHGLSEK